MIYLYNNYTIFSNAINLSHLNILFRLILKLLKCLEIISLQGYCSDFRGKIMGFFLKLTALLYSPYYKHMHNKSMINMIFSLLYSLYTLEYKGINKNKGFL